MKKPALDEFLSNSLSHYTPNAYVKEPGFASLYVRMNKRLLGETLHATLDIANVHASKPGKGAFTALVHRIASEYSHFTIYVENVHHERFQKKLESMGFIKHSYGGMCVSYYLPALKAAGT